MRRKLLVLLAIVAVLALLVAAPVMAKKPLKGTTTYDFMGGYGILRTVDDGMQLLGWQGNITGDITGCIEWWFYIPPGIVETGQASHYDTTTEIHERACPETTGPSTADVLLAADGSGTTTARHMKNSNWRANGTVTIATGDYEGWLGRKLHEGGNFEWHNLGTQEEPIWAPLKGVSMFRIN